MIHNRNIEQLVYGDTYYLKDQFVRIRTAGTYNWRITLPISTIEHVQHIECRYRDFSITLPIDMLIALNPPVFGQTITNVQPDTIEPAAVQFLSHVGDDVAQILLSSLQVHHNGPITVRDLQLEQRVRRL